MPLEPRIMYDGAAAATAHHHHADHHDAAASAHHFTPPPPPASGAPAAGGQWQHDNEWKQNGTIAAGSGAWQSHAAPDQPMPEVYTWVKDPTEIVFIDQQAPDWQLLANGVSPGIEVVVLNPNSDGVDQIADFLSRHPDPNLTTVDIVAHGSDGMLFLGNTVLDNDTVGQYATQLAQIGAALQPGGDLMLYGCDVAVDASGLIFLDQITQETGVNVAASTGPVGSAADGGTWTLDASSGLITASSPFTAATMAAYPDVLNADIFSVISGGLADGILYGTDNNGNSDGSATGVTNDYSGNNTNNAVFQASSLQQIQLDPQDGLYFVLLDDTGTGGPNKIIELSLTSLLNNPSSPATILATPFQDTNTSNSANAFYVDVADNVIFVNDIIGNNGGGAHPTADDFDVITFSGAHFTGTATTTVHNLGADYLDGMVVDPLLKEAYFYFTETSETIVGPHGGTTGGATSNGVHFAGNPTGTPGQQKDVFVISENALFKATWTGPNTNLGTVTLTQLPVAGGQTINGLANNVPTTDGIIEDLAIDNATGTLYFDTDSEDGSAAGIYSYNGTSHAISTVYTTNGAVSGGLTDFIIDPQTNKYYVVTENGSVNDIYDGSLTGGNPSLFIDVDTVDSALSNGGAVGLALDNSPTLTTSSSTVTYDQGGSAVTIDDPGAGITITDSDINNDGDNSELASATVSITAHMQSGDVLGIPTADLTSSTIDGTNITESYNSTTGVLTLTGADTAAHYELALSEVTFSSTATTPSVSARTITFAVSDGLLSGSATDTVDVHDKPVVTASGTVTFDGGGSAVTLDSGLTVTDASSSTLANATVSISGFISGDTLNFTNQNGITGTYNSSSGVLTLSGTATTAEYQTALDSITYSFTANSDPTGGGSHTTRTIDWTVNDGTLNSATATSTLDTVHVAPTVTPSGVIPTFDGGGAAVVLNGGLTVNDVDSGGNLTGATVTISSGYLIGDTLSVASSVLNGTGITATFSATNHDLVLSGTSTLANYQNVLDAVTYSFSPTNGDPTNSGGDTTRTISWSVTDASTSNGTSTAKTSTLDVVHVAPVATAGASVNYDVGGSAVALDNTLTVSDVDSGGNLTGATVSIGTGFNSADDSLHFTNQNSITGVYDAATGVLTLTGTSSIANYQTALESITFSTTAATAGTRTIDWVVADGSSSNGNSVQVTSTVAVLAGPLLSGTGATVNYQETGAAVTVDSGLTLTDPAGANITSATVTISSGFVSGDVLAIPAADLTSNTFTGTNITESYNSTTGVLALSGSDTAARY
jgi:hypothetical protein